MMAENTPSRPNTPASARADAPTELEERLRPLSVAERESMEAIYQRLLKVMDLSQLARLEGREARRQVREVCDRLLAARHPT